MSTSLPETQRENLQDYLNRRHGQAAFEGFTVIEGQKVRRGRSQHYEPVVNDTFRCPPDLQGCPIAQIPEVKVPLDIYRRWIFLAQQINTEWIAFCLGEEDPNKPNVYTITDFYFTPQKANGTHVEAEDGHLRAGTVAAVHSHVAMKAFFSGEDMLHANHPIELVVNRMGDIEATGRVQLECGKYHRGKAKITLLSAAGEMEEVAALKALITPDRGTFRTKVNEKPATQTPPQTQPQDQVAKTN